MDEIISVIENILQLAVQIGPTLAQLAIDFGPVEQAVAAILKGDTVTDDQLANLQAIADQLHEAVQASPETP